ncbi:DUF883 domain-containing protein [Paraburkholderia sp. MMS20-SJTN17]|uniref:DUF883 domain-containing protein n=1 Tax=Paraburkholderia translucens TaxID=2886945 RepID=A0ABS8KCN3_9BURK|nr:DUF883 domain-containing protein [Paraburkholderia sp. MMS20-SJTN17]MCC8402530.1 DUF883 domain-containing protein [Paraburkholderia sp. MMS20-SJTN17]
MSDTNATPADLENQVSETESAPSIEKTSKLLERARAKLEGARKKAVDVQVVAVESGKKAARTTDDFVHEHPWTSVSIAAGIGLLIGLLINRE